MIVCSQLLLILLGWRPMLKLTGSIYKKEKTRRPDITISLTGLFNWMHDNPELQNWPVSTNTPGACARRCQENNSHLQKGSTPTHCTFCHLLQRYVHGPDMPDSSLQHSQHDMSDPSALLPHHRLYEPPHDILLAGVSLELFHLLHSCTWTKAKMKITNLYYFAVDHGFKCLKFLIHIENLLNGGF
jgi:hypothetical protein